ncbi:MBL fold metallo-hydrolase [bacterium]|nr:MBL fold metallo-hydrolase [bacterium]
MVTVRLRFFPWGETVAPGFLVLRGGGPRLLRQPVLVGLLEHPREGRWLIDTGLHPCLAHLGFPLNLFVRLGRLALPAGPPPVQDLAGVFLSHFHLDHGAGLAGLQPKVLITSREGYESSRLGGELHPGWSQSLWPAGLFERTRWLENFSRSSHGPVTGFDLFDDGSVLAVSLPGHSHGHYGLLCQTERGRVFFIADACGVSQVLTRGVKQRAPSWIATDRRAEQRTQAWLRNLIHWCWLVPSHCPRAYLAVR